MHNQLKGIYAPYINQVIDVKRSIGFKYNTEKIILIGFDRFTIERGEKTLGITKELAESWRRYKPNESSSYKVHRLRCFTC